MDVQIFPNALGLALHLHRILPIATATAVGPGAVRGVCWRGAAEPQRATAAIMNWVRT